MDAAAPMTSMSGTSHEDEQASSSLGQMDQASAQHPADERAADGVPDTSMEASTSKVVFLEENHTSHGNADAEEPPSISPTTGHTTSKMTTADHDHPLLNIDSERDDQAPGSRHGKQKASEASSSHDAQPLAFFGRPCRVITRDDPDYGDLLRSCNDMAIGTNKYEVARSKGFLPIHTLAELRIMYESLTSVLENGQETDFGGAAGSSGHATPMSRSASAGSAFARGYFSSKPKRPKMERIVSSVEVEVEGSLDKLKELIIAEKHRLREHGAEVTDELPWEKNGAENADGADQHSVPANVGEAARQREQGAQQGQGRAPNAAAGAPAQANVNNVNANNQAAAVRRNLFYASWTGYNRLTRGRKILITFRFFSALAQIAVSIAILSLPTSLGNSPARPSQGNTCDPEPLFVWLLLHMLRVAAALPIDLYLGLSPHRSGRARRPTAQGFAERETNRAIGSLHLDRKLGKISDLLGFVHMVLFIVGNYIVYSNTECSGAPADSVPLFWTSFSMLAISYLIILEVILLILAIVFFLPMVIFIMRSLGLGDRLPRAGINPETGKISQQVVDEIKLVYFTPAEDDDAEAGNESTQDQIMQSALEAGQKAEGATTDIEAQSVKSRTDASSKKQSGGIARLFFSRKKEASDAIFGTGVDRKQKAGKDEDGSSTGLKLKYPLHPIPTHRATCPICLCDFERPEDAIRNAGTELSGGWRKEPAEDDAGAADSGKKKKKRKDKKKDEKAEEASEDFPEPLRLLECSHVFHKSCVDEWFTTVSGRCPVCQVPILKDRGEAAAAAAEDGAAAAA